MDAVVENNEQYFAMCKKYSNRYILIDNNYTTDTQLPQ